MARSCRVFFSVISVPLSNADGNDFKSTVAFLFCSETRLIFLNYQLFVLVDICFFLRSTFIMLTEPKGKPTEAIRGGR